MDTRQVIDSYIIVSESEPGTPAYKENFWAYEALDKLVSEQPSEAYDLVLHMLAHDLSEKSIAFIAAGPLEDLLSKHGALLIDRLEKDAEGNGALRHALGGVWQNAMPDDLWRRVAKAAGTRW